MLAGGQDLESYARKISSLIDPAKLATLGERQANPRVEKYVALLAEAKVGGLSPGRVTHRALTLVGMKGAAAKVTQEAMVRNVTIAERLGCLDEAGLEGMRNGHGATVGSGPYKGQQVSVDHIIPRAVVPELDNVIANLELLPLRVNEKKQSKIGQRQRSLARKLNEAGLLSKAGLAAVLAR